MAPLSAVISQERPRWEIPDAQLPAETLPAEGFVSSRASSALPDPAADGAYVMEGSPAVNLLLRPDKRAFP